MLTAAHSQIGLPGHRLTMTAAVALHARRFGRRRPASLLALITGDRCWRGAAAVAVTTAVPTRLGVVVWVLAGVTALTTAVIGALVMALQGSSASGGPAPAAAVLSLAGAVAFVPLVLATRRREAARRRWPGRHRSWVLGDMAAVEGAAGATPLLAAILAAARSRRARVVLLVRSDNAPAIRLYAEHGFVADPSHRPIWARRGPDTGPDAPSLLAMRAPSPVSPAVRPRLERSAVGVVIAVAATIALTIHVAPAPTAWLAPIVVSLGTVAAFADTATMRVPNALTLAGLMATLAVVVGWSIAEPATAGRAALGVAIMGGPLLVVHVASPSHTPGLGDVKLAAVLGLACGAARPLAAYVTLVVALLVGAAYGLGFRLATSRRTFPFAPALAVGAVVALWTLT